MNDRRSAVRRSAIVHADDLGMTRAANAGIAEAAERGVLSSVSIVANGRAFEEAVANVIPGSGLGVGVHLNLTEGRPLTGDAARALCRADGELPRSWLAVARASRDPRFLEAAEREIRAQFERTLESCPNIDHVNSHEHVHMLPPIFAIVCRVAAELGVRVVRIPAERRHGRLSRHHDASAPGPANLAKVELLNALSRRCAPIARGHGLDTNATFVGVRHTGSMSVATAAAGLEAASEMEGPLELLLHPARQPPGRDESFPTANARDYALDPNRSAELRTLCDPALAAVLRAADREPTCYRCLEAACNREPRPHHHRSEPLPRPVPSRPPLRTVAVIDETPTLHPGYVRRLLTECEDARFVAVALVKPVGGTGPERWMKRNLRRLRPAELLRLGTRQVGLRAWSRLAPPALRRRWPGSVANVLEATGIPVRDVSTFKDESFRNWLREIEPDLLVSSNSLIFDPELLALPKVAAINRHSALLPSYGGVLPVFRALAAGEPFVGASVHRMTAEIDEGEVLSRHWVPVFASDTLETLYRACFRVSYDATAEAIAALRTGEPLTAPTEGLEPSYFSFPEPADWASFRAAGGRLI